MFSLNWRNWNISSEVRYRVLHITWSNIWCLYLVSVITYPCCKECLWRDTCLCNSATVLRRWVHSVPPVTSCSVSWFIVILTMVDDAELMWTVENYTWLFSWCFVARLAENIDGASEAQWCEDSGHIYGGWERTCIFFLKSVRTI